MTKVKLTPQLKFQIRSIMKKRSPQFLMELKRRLNEIKMKRDDNAN